MLAFGYSANAGEEGFCLRPQMNRNTPVVILSQNTTFIDANLHIIAYPV
jgi:hypothetical protein